MNIQQLLEGQREQIEGLRPRSVVRMYHGTTLDEAYHLVRSGVNRGENLVVTHDLKHALVANEAVVEFYTQGRYLAPPQELGSEYQDKYPDSAQPSVTASLLDSKRPYVYFIGHLNKNEIDTIFLTGYDDEGQKVSVTPGSYASHMNPKHFSDWYFKNIYKARALARQRNRDTVRGPDRLTALNRAA